MVGMLRGKEEVCVQRLMLFGNLMLLAPWRYPHTCDAGGHDTKLYGMAQYLPTDSTRI